MGSDVNDHTRHAARHCALCGSTIEEGYVRDPQMRVLFCEARCFGGYAFFGENFARKAS